MGKPAAEGATRADAWVSPGAMAAANVEARGLTEGVSLVLALGLGTRVERRYDAVDNTTDRVGDRA